MRRGQFRRIHPEKRCPNYIAQYNKQNGKSESRKTTKKMNPKVTVSSEPKQMVSYTHQPVSPNTQNFEKCRTPNLHNFGMTYT